MVQATDPMNVSLSHHTTPNAPPPQLNVFNLNPLVPLETLNKQTKTTKICIYMGEHSVLYELK